MVRSGVLHVVANVYSKVHSNIQGQNLHQLLTCRIHPDARRPASAHHLFSRQPGTWSSRRVAWTGAQTPIRVARTRVAAGIIQANPRVGGESAKKKERQRSTVWIDHQRRSRQD